MHGLAKLANDDSNLDEIGAGGLTAGSALLMKKKLPDVQSKLTGMERFYHGTDAKNVPSIQEKGLLGSKSLEGKQVPVIMQQAGLSEEEMANKVYLTRNKKYAKVNADILSRLYRHDPGVINAQVPYEDLKNGTVKEVANPELHGATSKKEFVNRRIERLIDHSWESGEWKDFVESKEELRPIHDNLFQRVMLGKLYNGVQAPNSITIDGDLPSQYIEGAKDFHGGQTLKGWGEYVRNNPGRFAKGIGMATAGPALGLAGLGYIANEKLNNE